MTLVCRRPSLADNMSQYLQDEIEAAGVHVRLSTIIVDAEGEGRLQGLTLRDASGAREMLPADAAFVLVGGQPRSDWLPQEVERDERGFILTGGWGVHVRDVVPGRVRDRRRQSRVGQARRLGRRRGLGRDPAGASVPRVCSLGQSNSWIGPHRVKMRPWRFRRPARESASGVQPLAGTRGDQRGAGGGVPRS